MKKRRKRGDTKGFLFEADDISKLLLCRDVRGFPPALEAAKNHPKDHPGRLVLVVPNLDLEDYLLRWADDVGHARRTLTITRRTDGQQIRLVATILAFGSGIDTAISIERLMADTGAAAPARAPGSDVGAADARTSELDMIVRRKTPRAKGRRSA